MNMLRSLMRPLVLLVLLLGCRHASEADGGSPSGGSAVRDDLHVLCERLAAGQISAWSQPVYRSRKVRELTLAIDRNDDGARCRLAALIRKHRLRECQEAEDSLSLRCDF